MKRKSSTDKKHEINQKYDGKALTFADEIRNNYEVNDIEESSTNKIMSFKQDINSKENSYSQPEIDLKHKSGDAMQSTEDDSSTKSNEIELEASIEAIKRKERTLSSSMSGKFFILKCLFYTVNLNLTNFNLYLFILSFIIIKQKKKNLTNKIKALLRNYPKLNILTLKTSLYLQVCKILYYVLCLDKLPPNLKTWVKRF